MNARAVEIGDVTGQVLGSLALAEAQNRAMPTRQSGSGRALGAPEGAGRPGPPAESLANPGSVSDRAQIVAQ